MKVKNVKKWKLTNGLHLQFMVEILVLINKFAVMCSKFVNLLPMFKEKIEQEELCHKVIRKSNISDLKIECDYARDTILIGIKNAFGSLLRHFDVNVREATHRIKIVFDAYNKPRQIKDLPYDAETVAINNMLQELEGKYAADLQITGLADWMKELRARNDAFDQLVKSYTEEQAGKPLLTPKDARRETDRIYTCIVDAINGLVILENEEEYAQFIIEMNTIIKHYNDLTARHYGRLHSEKEKEKEKEGEKVKKDGQTNEPPKQTVTGEVNTAEQVNVKVKK
jgi:hypothetical protein